MKNKSLTNIEEGQVLISKGIMIFISIFLVLVLLFGTVFGAIFAIRHKNAVIEYGDLTMDREVASFFLSYYKTQYMAALSEAIKMQVPDDEWFWYSEYEDGKTYGDALKEASIEYIKSILVKAHLFDSYTEITDEGEAFIDKCIDEILTQRGGSNVESFNASVREYGFSFNSFRKAAKLLYKAKNAEALIYGVSGENVADRADVCAEYLNTYSHVKLLFIRTENEFLLDKDGNRVPGPEGDTLRPLTETERIERQNAINTIRESILAYEKNENGQMTPEFFDIQLKKYDSAGELFHKYGYYLNEKSTYTQGFARNISEDVAKKAINMELNSYAEIELDYGVCFIYKYKTENNAYLLKGLDIFFDDFYTGCASYAFAKDVSILSTDALIKEKFFDINVITLPYNPVYIPRFN